MVSVYNQLDLAIHTSPRSSTAKNQRWVIGVTVDQELAVGSVGAPTDPRETEWTVGQLWQRFGKKGPDSCLGFQWHLGLFEGDAPHIAVGGFSHVGVPRMLVTNFDLSALLIWLEKEPPFQC